MALTDQAFITALRLLPKNALSRLVGAATRLNAPAPVRLAAMRAFAARYGIDLSEYDDLATYRTFAEFFSRPIKSGRRAIAPGADVLVSPVDGVVSEAGVAAGDRLVQAKGIDYRLAELLADRDLAARFADGAYATIYLSPRDYHRIHFPLGGAIQGYRYVPGHLWPVNPTSVRTVPNLFAINERLTTLLETPLGLCAVVAVGATIVGRIRAYYDPTIPVTNAAGGRPLSHTYPSPIPVEKGAELGAFEMGSTVILLLEKGRAALLPRVVAGARLRVGEPIGGPAPRRGEAV